MKLSLARVPCLKARHNVIYFHTCFIFISLIFTISSDLYPTYKDKIISAERSYSSKISLFAI